MRNRTAKAGRTMPVALPVHSAATIARLPVVVPSAARKRAAPMVVRKVVGARETVRVVAIVRVALPKLAVPSQSKIQNQFAQREHRKALPFFVA